MVNSNQAGSHHSTQIIHLPYKPAWAIPEELLPPIVGIVWLDLASGWRTAEEEVGSHLSVSQP